MTLLARTSPLFPSKPSFLSGFFDDDRLWNYDLGNGLVAKAPSANVIENKDEFVIELAAPGMTKKDFQIDVENGNLCISSEKEEETKEEDDNFTRREFSYNSFSRSFLLPETVEAEKIKAKYQDGILKLAIPKKPAAKKLERKHIAIS